MNAPKIQLDLSNNPLFQSPYTYLQAAGSDGNDDTVKGWHLRWDFKRNLGAEHLPKGNLSGPGGVHPATYGFNRDNDFVKIYKTDFREKYFTRVNFNDDTPSIINDTTGTTREWTFQGIQPNGLGGVSNDVIIRFNDDVEYDRVKNLPTDPTTDPGDFIAAYEGIIEAEVIGKLMFRIDWDMSAINKKNAQNASLRAETISFEDVSDPNSLYISCREAFSLQNSSRKPFIECDNIDYTRFDFSLSFPRKMSFYCYEDYVAGSNIGQGSWIHLGDFSLTKTTTEAEDRLEDTNLFTIDGQWPKFNDDSASGAFKVKVANYQDRWSMTDGLRDGVVQYLTLTEDPQINPDHYRAIVNVPITPSGNLPNSGSMDVSYFDLLNVASLDFHNARMLGLGHILADERARDKDRCIFMMEYVTEAALDDGNPAQLVTHFYMSLPTGILDFRTPPSPEMQPITYGITVDNGTVVPTSLTDEFGYTPYADSRFININREPFQYELPFEEFFESGGTFCLCDESIPVAFGVEYRLNTESNYRIPELNHDPLYTDLETPVGIPETIVIPETGTNPVYVHIEQEEGIHCYGLYSVNWFSRVSPVSAPECTDLTLFPKRSTLLPPSNFGVQLIQEETPLIFTTTAEQAALVALQGPDKTYVRAQFDWNHLHQKAHQFADKAELFFREEEASVIKGKIANITNLPGNLVRIETTSYTITSGAATETITPQIPDADVSRYENATFSSDGRFYIIDSIEAPNPNTNGDNPVFILQQIKETASVEQPLNSNLWVTTETFISPTLNERFLVTENLAVPGAWDSRLAKTVYLEKFSTNDTLSIENSTNNDNDYEIVSVTLNGANTNIVVQGNIDDTVVDGEILYNKIERVTAFTTNNDGFVVTGDLTNDLNPGEEITIFGSLNNDGVYTIDTLTLNSGDTEVVVLEAINTTYAPACLAWQKRQNITGLNTTNSLVTVAGDITNELIPSYKESVNNLDGTTSQFIMGGILATASINEEPDVYNALNVPGGSSPGDPVPASRTGIYKIVFDSYQLPDHIDPEVSWRGGQIRIEEDSGFLPSAAEPLRTDTIYKTLDVWSIDRTGATLELVVHDASFNADFASGYTPSGDYVPIQTGGGLAVNFHPGYKVYLTTDNFNGNNFDEATMLPATGEGSKKTYMAIRSVDSRINDILLDDCVSVISNPAQVLAQEIIVPLPPNPPQGPLYATRPDFYGKSTYTLDTSFLNNPYAVIFYRSSERAILDTLYKPDTIENIILPALEQIPVTDPDFSQFWTDFVNVNLDGNNEFIAHPGTGFQMPIPDSDTYLLPIAAEPPIFEYPFDQGLNFGDTFTYVNNAGQTVPNPALPFQEIVKEAINGAFNALTENPIVYEYVRDGEQTRNVKPVIRDDNGIQITPDVLNLEYDPSPMAVKLTGGEIRFTDYTIDGGSNSFYFYYALEFTNKLEKGPRSAIVGPVQLINTAPAEAPQIKEVLTQIENEPNGIETAVCFDINDYIVSEGVTELDIYRANNSVDALTVRTMELANTVVVDPNNPMVYKDEFEGLPFPLYGDDLHYRLVARRLITLEDQVTTENIPSLASKVVKATLVDPNNPPAPCITSENGNTTATELQNVIIKWEQVGYNITYRLQKQNAEGNWEEVYSIQSNDATMQYPPLVGGSPDFANFDATALLPREDADGAPLYHRFRVQVENSSGLFNLEDCPITLATGCFDLAAVEPYISFTDNHGFNLPELISGEVDDGVNNNPGKMVFDFNVQAILPAGHNNFDHIEIDITDDQGNTSTQNVATPNGQAVFNDGDGGLLLADPNHSYTIRVELFTDFCTDGYTQVFNLDYVNGPCNDLSNLTDIVSLTDNDHTLPVLSSAEINNGEPQPVFLTFTGITNVSSIGQTFDRIEITLADTAGNSDTKTITTENGSVTFNDGDNGLILNDGEVNRNYTVSAKLVTAECTAGTVFDYSIIYSYDACAELEALTAIVSFADNNSANLSPLADGDVDNGFNHPGDSITITDLIGSNLPSGHTFVSLEVSVNDGQGGYDSQPLAVGASHVFNTGDGIDANSLLDLGASNPNALYTISVNLVTDKCPDGAFYTYFLNYTYNPCVEIGNLTDIVNLQDGNGLSITPLALGDFDDGTNNNPGGSFTFTDVFTPNLPLGDSLTKIEITVDDGTGTTVTDEITSPLGNVTINSGIDLSSANRTYTFTINVITTLCPGGVTFVYAGRYVNGL